MKNHFNMQNLALVLSAVCTISLFSGCATIPKGAVAVNNLDKAKYLGKWYEAARFDFSFEKNLNNTTAQYTLRKDGYIGVLNAGYNYKKNKWESAQGKARFRGADTVGELEVSFFGPFYGAYNIIALDPDYKYALIAGKNTNYLWILSREKTIPDDVKQRYVSIAESLGYDTRRLIWVEHNQ
jgi:apolipoprotein D and lipocalin family protein